MINRRRFQVVCMYPVLLGQQNIVLNQISGGECRACMGFGTLDLRTLVGHL